MKSNGQSRWRYRSVIGSPNKYSMRRLQSGLRTTTLRLAMSFIQVAALRAETSSGMPDSAFELYEGGADFSADVLRCAENGDHFTYGHRVFGPATVVAGAQKAWRALPWLDAQLSPTFVHIHDVLSQHSPHSSTREPDSPLAILCGLQPGRAALKDRFRSEGWRGSKRSFAHCSCAETRTTRE